MAVPKYKRTPTQFEILQKCGKATAYTIKLVSNEKYFPKRYRWCVSSKLIDTMLNVMKYIQEANAINVSTKLEYDMRYSFQRRASTELRAVFNLMEVAYNLFKIDDDKIDSWVGIMLELQQSIKNWIDSDKKRYSTVVKNEE